MTKPKDRRIRWWKWDEGSLSAPVRIDALDGSPVYRAPRILLDWNGPYGEPRRLYYFGKRVEWILALERDAKSQLWSWRHRWWTLNWGYLSVHPANYRQIARTPPWMKRFEHATNSRPRPTDLKHRVSTTFTSDEWKLLCDAVEGLDRGVTWYVRQAALDAARRGWVGS